jgi:hypothetical protein
MSACRIEIRVKEPLADWWSEWFSELELIPDGPPSSVDEESGTLLRGSLPDQSALFGVLARIRDLNLTLISMKRLPPG